MEKKKDFIIPLQKKVNWRTPARQQDTNKGSEKNEEELALDKEAAAAIIKGLLLYTIIKML